jgi:molybdate transport system substrate-binding protein
VKTPLPTSGQTSARPRRRSLTALLGAATLMVTLAACSAPADNAPADDTARTESAAPSSSTSTLAGSITVFAAASLTSTFTDIAEDFEEENPDVTVQLNFAGSSDLVTQITEGAPADVFASADLRNYTTLAEAGLTAGDAVNFATNTLTIAVPARNPAEIGNLSDLADPDVRTVICAPQVPCGAATVTVTQAAGVTLTPVSEESSVTDVLGKVSSGEADAGIVYVTDVLAAGDGVEAVEIPEASSAVNTYPIVAVADSGPDADAGTSAIAQAFIQYVTGTAGLGVLAEAGFGPPE